MLNEIILFRNEYSGNTPITYAAECGHEAVVDYLLKMGADVNGKFSNTDKVSWNVSECNNVINGWNYWPIGLLCKL